MIQILTYDDRLANGDNLTGLAHLGENGAWWTDLPVDATHLRLWHPTGAIHERIRPLPWFPGASGRA